MTSIPVNDLKRINTEGLKNSSVLTLDIELSIVLTKLKKMSQEPILESFLVWDYQTEKWVNGKWLRKWFRSVGRAYNKVCNGIYDFTE